jgi:hypothetical protein
MRALAQLLQNPQARRRRSPQGSQQQNLLNRRHLLSIPTPLLFFPWKGCTEGEFYDTGKYGVASEFPNNPARLTQKPSLFLSPNLCSTYTGITDNCQKIYQPAQEAAQEAEQRFKKQQPSVASSNTNTSSKEELKRLVNEHKEYDRAVLEDDGQKRTNIMVGNMWQTLE